MENIKDMVDVNTVVGDPVTAGDGTTIIPISRVSFGFVSGGGEYNATRDEPARDSGGAGYSGEELPFAGGTGAGVSVHPMGFLVVGQGQVKMLPTNYATPIDRVMELLPQVIGEVKDIFQDDSHASSNTVSRSAAPSQPRHSRSIPVEGRTIGSGLDKDLPGYTNNNGYNESFTHPGKPVVNDPVSGSHMASSAYNTRYDNKQDNSRFDGKYDTKADAKAKLDTKFDTKANSGLNGSSSATVTNSVNASSIGKNT
jgi:sporulation protein YtfJ